jgi:hypothetical protein
MGETANQERRPFKWRRWNNILHRDIGYLIVGLTVVYGISGIAVNHREDWNPNYQINKEIQTIEPIQSTESGAIVAEVMQKLQLASPPKNSFRPDPETVQLFFDKKNYTVDLPTGKVLMEATQPRRVLYEMNQLHLNTPKNAWTYIADLYAFSLVFVAITGLFVLKGRTGITGRGAWLTSVGILIPVAYLFYYFYMS